MYIGVISLTFLVHSLYALMQLSSILFYELCFVLEYERASFRDNNQVKRLGFNICLHGTGLKGASCVRLCIDVNSAVSTLTVPHTLAITNSRESETGKGATACELYL